MAKASASAGVRSATFAHWILFFATSDCHTVVVDPPRVYDSFRLTSTHGWPLRYYEYNHDCLLSRADATSASHDSRLNTGLPSLTVLLVADLLSKSRLNPIMWRCRTAWTDCTLLLSGLLFTVVQYLCFSDLCAR
ncbi:hypothetical protein ARMGADRAFT_1020984 [Armillaria gallica]|uniref:Secreted protein n=1 Tax=Armillaria gallica TaxID=47427 RepID=A0A2H3CEL7_ARMGA|nr:hypothetical protein ARMGADRAFT_1020984 [Armillaria gallica]